MAEHGKTEHYNILQIAPEAEPEVIAAAYRALAKKYHPDRSDAPDAMARMARINVAYQALRSRITGRLSEADSGPVQEPTGPFTRERVNPTSSLEEALEIVNRKVAAARKQILDEVVQDGFAKDIATGLVQKAFRQTAGLRGESSGGNAKSTHIDPHSSYDEALRVASQRAQAMRDELSDELARGGLQKKVAVELADASFERIRRRSEAQGQQRLSPDRVDLSSSLEKGVKVVAGKLKAARRVVVEELTRDGVPQKTAEQLVESAAERMDWSNPGR